MLNVKESMGHQVKLYIRFIAIMFMMAGISMSCTFYNEKDYFGIECQTEGMTYDSLTYVFGICSECHSDAFTYRTGIEMDTYESVVKSINTGLVMPAIKHEGAYLMPYNLSKLPDCDISKIESWINDGMPENNEK